MPSTTTERFLAMRGKEPDEAGFFWSGGPIEVAERTFFQSRFSGVTAFETDEGIVLVDSGMAPLGPILAGMLRQKSPAPIHTAIFTHGHVDHAHGLSAFLAPGQARPRIIAQRKMLERFARYALTSPFNAAINARQFGGTPHRADKGGEYDNFRPPTLVPDTLYDDAIDITVGGVSFDIRHARGETDDHSFGVVPRARRAVHRRLVHLRGAQCRQSAEGAALSMGLGDGAARHGRAEAEEPLPGPRWTGGAGRRQGSAHPDRDSGLPRHDRGAHGGRS